MVSPMEQFVIKPVIPLGGGLAVTNAVLFMIGAVAVIVGGLLLLGCGLASLRLHGPDVHLPERCPASRPLIGRHKGRRPVICPTASCPDILPAGDHGARAETNCIVSSQNRR